MSTFSNKFLSGINIGGSTERLLCADPALIHHPDCHMLVREQRGYGSAVTTYIHICNYASDRFEAKHTLI
jgi:hypothetical protein